MVSARIAACIVLVAPSLASATTVVADANISLSPGGDLGDYTLTVYQDAAGTDYTEVFLDFDGTNVNFVTGVIDEGSDWYLVDNGDAFSKGNVVSGLFTALFVNLSSSGPVPVGPDNFFLGVNTGLGFDGSPLPPNRDEFGWIELSSSGTDLVQVGNAVAYGAGGIVVGTTIPIPEPSTALLLASGLVALVLWRGSVRRRHIGPRGSL